jgi:hypothetical protein
VVPLGDGTLADNELRGRLHVDLHVSRSELLDVYDLNGWVLHRYADESANHAVDGTASIGAI